MVSWAWSGRHSTADIAPTAADGDDSVITIGTPTGFRHNLHMNIDGTWGDFKNLLASAGVSEHQLDDSEFLKVLYDALRNAALRNESYVDEHVNSPTSSPASPASVPQRSAMSDSFCSAGSADAPKEDETTPDSEQTPQSDKRRYSAKCVDILSRMSPTQLAAVPDHVKTLTDKRRIRDLTAIQELPLQE
eukprot:TRINITY_DN2501_c0_g1_i1.p1 TRINITY_DN2501_c0_g1~~TRINITY_DN2501_c0_g1_i1.p1  ORF type:complete len:190 (+),score=51.15 TRINITY_DN2501_c0_g1_i1:617-1186(+)